MKYKNIVAELLKNGKIDLPKWDKEEFILVCIEDFQVCRQTAEKVYQGYHEAIKTK